MVRNTKVTQVPPVPGPGQPPAVPVVFTIGHSTRDIDRFIALLEREHIQHIADVRSFPGSRRYPQYGRDALAASLAERGIGYSHHPELGGRRRTRADSPNGAWRNESFRLAGLARTRMRGKICRLQEAFTGRFGGHHAFLLARMLAHVDAINADIAAVEDRIEELIGPFAPAAARLDEIPGVGLTAARAILAEVGVNMTRFPTPGHLASWARFTPGVKESAGRQKGNAATGHGDPYLARVLGEAAVGAARTNTFLGERYRRIARRRGNKKAIVAVGRSILTIVWHLLSDPQAKFHDLGPGFYDGRIGPDRKKRNHVRELEALGYKVTLEPVA